MEFAVARDPMGERKAQPVGRGARRKEAFRRLELRQVDQAPVVAEVLRDQFRMAIETEAADHQPVEVAQQEIGDVEGAGFLNAERCKRLAAAKNS